MLVWGHLHWGWLLLDYFEALERLRKILVNINMLFPLLPNYLGYYVNQEYHQTCLSRSVPFPAISTHQPIIIINSSKTHLTHPISTVRISLSLFHSLLPVDRIAIRTSPISHKQRSLIPLTLHVRTSPCFFQRELCQSSLSTCNDTFASCPVDVVVNLVFACCVVGTEYFAHLDMWLGILMV